MVSWRPFFLCLPPSQLLYPLFLPSPPHPMTVLVGDKTQPLSPRTEAAASPQEPPHGPIHLDRPVIRVEGRGGDSRPPQLQLPAPPHSRPAQLSTLASRPCAARCPGRCLTAPRENTSACRRPLLRPQQAVGRRRADTLPALEHPQTSLPK